MRRQIDIGCVQNTTTFVGSYSVVRLLQMLEVSWHLNLFDPYKLLIWQQVVHLSYLSGLPRPVCQYPNTGSPWHPGCIERCFCPDLAKKDNEALLRLCKYTNSRGGGGSNTKYTHSKKVSRNENYYSNPGSSSSNESISEGSMETNDGGDIFYLPRSNKNGRASPTRLLTRSPRIGRLGACERNPNNHQIPRNMNHRSTSPKKITPPSGDSGWYSPPPPLMRPTIQVSSRNEINLS